MAVSVLHGSGVDRRPPMLGALVLGAVLIAFAPVFVRISEVGPVASGFYRVAIALPVLALLMLRQETAPAPAGRRPAAVDLLLLAAAGVFLALDLGVWHISIQMTSIANATLFNNSAPIFVALAIWLGGGRLSRSFVLALAGAAGGMALLSAGGGGLAAQGDALIGDALAISTGAFYAAYILLLARVRRRVSTAVCMLVSTTAAVPCLLLFSLALGEPLRPVSWQGWATLAGLALVCHVAGQGLIARALAVLPVASSAMALLIQPVAAALLAWALFGERQTPVQILGIAAVLTGILVAQRSVWAGHGRH